MSEEFEGNRTRSALNEFQENQQLPVTDEVDEAVMVILKQHALG